MHSGFSWFLTKKSKKNTTNSISEIDQLQITIPITHICTSSNEIRAVINEYLQISSSKIQFNYFKYPDKLQPANIEINCTTIKEVQYSDTNDVLRVVVQTDIFFKYFHHKNIEDDLFKDTIWFCLSSVDLAKHKDVINNLLCNFISTFPITKMPKKLHRQFIAQLNKVIVKDDYFVKSNSDDLIKPDVSQFENNNLCSNNSELKMFPSLKSNKLLSVCENNNSQICTKLNIESHLVKLKRKLKRHVIVPELILEKKVKISNQFYRKLLYSPTSKDSVEIRESDLSCLSNGKYLNDNIINLYLTYIYFEQLSQSQRDKTYFFNVFFNTKLIGSASQQKIDTPETRHERVAKWTKNVDIFSKDFIVIPVIEEKHWFLVIVCFPWMAGLIDYSKLFNKPSVDCSDIPVNKTEFATKIRIGRRSEILMEQKVNAMPCILIFDSLQFQNKSTKVNIIREYLKSEWDAKRSIKNGSLIFEKNTCRGYSPIVLKQNNGTDCGLYLLEYVEYFFKNPLQSYDLSVFKQGFVHWFKRSVIDNKRKLMKSIILSKTKVVLPTVEEDNDDGFNIL